MKQLQKIVKGILFTAAAAALLLLAKPVGDSVRNGIDICLKVLIPSLFAFMVLADFSVKTGMLDLLLKPFGWLCGKLFHIDSSLGPVVLMSLIGGYPVGSKLLTDLVLEGKLEKADAQRMLCFCVNSGPAFVIGSVAIPLFGNTTLGFLMFASHLTAFFVVGIVSGIGKKTFELNCPAVRPGYAAALVGSVNSATRAMSSICAFVLVFSSLIGLLKLTGVLGVAGNALAQVMPRPAADAILTGILEVTNGTNACAGVNGLAALLIPTALTAFGGLCVHMQIIAIITRAKLKAGRFVLFRLLYTAVSTLTMLLFITCFPNAVSTMAFNPPVAVHSFSFSPASSFFLLILAVLLLLTCRKSATIECKQFLHPARRNKLGK